MMNSWIKSHWVLALFCICLVASPAVAQDDDDQEDPEKPTVNSLEDVMSAYDNAQREYFKLYRKATAEERKKLSSDRPSTEPYFDKVLELLEAEPKSEETIKFLQWWIYRPAKRNHRAVIVKHMMSHLSQSSDIAGLISSIPLGSKSPRPLLEKLIEDNQHSEVIANAIFTLHGLLRQKMDRLDPTSESDSTLKESLTDDMDSLEARLKNEFADEADQRGVSFVSKLEAIAFSKQLAIGKPVPDIVGEDIDGKEFKLSDYKGKVTVIDFWGDW